ncbi:CPBP family intramembrane glutamic endopeptidase [Actinosynnema sp. NPDC020468]|uniref:CPBP family intramembrane glutamic endopeptidase n=1 Tax=Actinosynnema sp. NPDC020468 TaxID=3154488 RepID=UPI0033C0E744
MGEHSVVKAPARNLSVWGYVAVVVAYLVVVQGSSLFLTRDLDSEYAAPTTVDAVWRSITVPVGLSLLVVVGVVTALGWWRPVLVDDKPVRPWVIAVPTIMLAAIVLGTNYAGLADRGLGFTALLLIGALFVGFAEEGMFRGLGLTAFRRNGFSEGKAALWSTVIFGLAHATNVISEGPGSFVQVLVAALSGYFLYLVRRRSAGLLLPAVVHGLWDFSLISASVVPGKGYFGPVLNILALVVLTVLVLVRRHQVEPAR